MELKEYLRVYREQHDMSQRQLAEACDVSNGYISMLERGENPKTKQPVTPTLQMLRKLAQGMGVSLNTMLTEVDDIQIDLLTEEEKISALVSESGLSDPLDMELLSVILRLSSEKKVQALSYFRYLLSCEDK